MGQRTALLGMADGGEDAKEVDGIATRQESEWEPVPGTEWARVPR